MWHAWERTEKCTRFWWESQREGDHLEDQGVDGKMGQNAVIIYQSKTGVSDLKITR
jgi:hypothetical protein